MALIKFGGGVITRDDARLLDPSSMTVAAYVEHRPGSDGLSETGTFQSAGTIGPSEGVKTCAGLVYANWDVQGPFLIADYGVNLVEGAAASSGMTGAKVNLEDDGVLAFNSAPLVLQGQMFNDRLYLISGVGVNGSDGGRDDRNLVREPTGRWRREGIREPANFAGVIDVTITSNPSEPSYTYRCLYNSSLSDTAQISGGHAPEDTDDSTAAVIRVQNPNTRHGVWDFRTIAGGQPTTGKGVLRIFAAGGPRAAWSDIGIGGAGRYDIDSDINIYYSTNNGSSYTLIATRKGPFLGEWFSVDLTANTLTITNIKVKVEVVKNSGSLDATAFVGTVRFDTGSGAAAAINTATDQGIHYLLTLYSDPQFGGSGLEGSPCPFGKAVVFSATDYPSGVKSISWDFPAGRDQDNNATHFKIYRAPDGTLPTILNRYGLIDTVKITRDGTTQTYTDSFITWPITEVPQPVIPNFALGSGDNIRYFPRGDVPPIAVSQAVYKGSRILVKDGDTNIYYSHPYEWESFTGIYQIPSRSPRNDQPQAVASLQEAWLVFYRDYTRRVQGLPLVLDGQFDATSYSEANESRGACGPRAVCTITRDGDSGNAWLFCVDRLGFYIRNEAQLIPWSRNVIWTDHATPANGWADPDADALKKLTVFHNTIKERVEIRFLRPNRSNDRQFWRLDVYYNRMREDGQPVILGPHYMDIYARVAAGYDEDGSQRIWATTTEGVLIFLADTGVLNYASSPVERTVRTGYFQLGPGPGEDAYLQYVALFMATDANNPGDILTTFTLSRNGYEDSDYDQNFRPSAPARVGIWAKGEFLSLYITDSLGGSTGYDRSEILGMELFFLGGDSPQSAQRSSANRNFNTTTSLPT